LQHKIRKYILVGHSDGASIALIHAAENPAEYLLGIVNVAPHVFCEQLTTDSIQKVQQLYLSGNLRELLQKHHGANVGCAFHGWADVWLHPDFRDWNIEAFLPAVDVPALLIQGTRDEYGSLAQLDAIETGVSAQVERLVLEGVGHSPHRERPAVALEAVCRFVHDLLAEPKC